MAKPRQPRAKRAILPCCFWLASATRNTIVAAGGVLGPCVRASTGVVEEDEDNGVEVEVEVLV